MDFDYQITTQTPKDTKNFGTDLIQKLLKKNYEYFPPILLYGELGSGKSVFVQGVAKGLEIHKRLISPTFVLMRNYLSSQKNINLIHIDLYRLESNFSLISLDLDLKNIKKKTIYCIEWAERLMENDIPQGSIKLFFDSYKNSRVIKSNFQIV